MTRAFRLIGAFFAWWLGELGALVPGRLRRPFQPEAPVLVVEPSGDELSMRLFRGERRRDLGRVRLEDKDPVEQRRAVDALAKGIKRGKAEVALRLPAEKALHSTLALPWVPESDLRQALYFQIDRQTPFAPDEVYFDYRVSARDRAAKRLTVEMTVVPRGVVDEALAAAERLGLAPGIVDVAGEDADAPPRLNLLSEAEASAPRGWSGLNVALALVAVGLAGALVYLPLEQREATAEALRDRVAEAREEAREVLRLRAEVDRLETAGGFLSREKRSSPSMVALMDELTAVLPDHTWLFELRLRGREVYISGYSSAASSLLGLIAQSPLFQAPRFRASVTQDPRSGLERFRVSFQVAEDGGER